MTVEEFVKRLEQISLYQGVPYGRAHLLFEEEEKHAHAVLQFQGYLALSDAFKCLFLETVELVNTHCRPKVKAPLSEYYAMLLPKLAQSFRTLCGAERVAICGYPYIAYTSLRNVFDNHVLTSAAAQKLTDFYAIEGIERDKPFDPEAARKLRKATEFAVRRQMIGNQSGLSPESIAELAIWDGLFDYETHGSRLSLASAMSWIKGTAPLPVLPKFETQAFAMFLNRYCEIAWMTHRLLPLIQPQDAPLPDLWKEKWRILDESFKITVIALTEQVGRRIGAAMVEFVDAKFPYNESSHFPL